MISSTSLPEVAISLELNSLTYLFSGLVFLIGFCTNIYALNYFKNEADELGFIFWLNSFVASMVILVLSNNFFTLFLGWELIGLTSFFLINFWNSRRATLKSSFKAFSFNLVSDLSLLIFLVSLYLQYGTTNISEIISQILATRNFAVFENQATVMALIVCASIKSVQILGHLWLPDSMEAPVPASSLIHSATLVSAGIFLLLRFNVLIIESGLMSFLIFLGGLTAAYGAIVSAAQTDVKKLLAYSTMSHCGFLFALTAMGDPYITIIYLILHGVFKAATFFCVGSFIRLYGTQDTRLMGGAAQLYWGDTFLLLLCAANLCGLPFTVGITYKTFFFKLLFSNSISFFSLGCFFVAMLASLIYFYRLVYYLLFDYWKILWGSSPLLFESFRHRGIKDVRVRLFKKIYPESRLTTTGAWFAVFLLSYVGLYIYRTIILHEEIIILGGEYLTQYSNTHNFMYAYIMQFYTVYLIYFYSLYTIIFLMLVFVTWRKNIFFFNKLYLYIYLIISLIVFFFINMWGYILTEANTITNFNFGFSTYKSDILLHLSQWQYWWWFWFSLFWALYFFIIIRLVNKRTFTFNPIINTSIRGHGKWGDFLVALIPLSWCGNILVNSNFILRMIEWQNESSLFTLRIQGKQWYWVYKFDASASHSILTAPKNIGHNRWAVITPQESYCVDSYYQALHLGVQLEYKSLYYKYINDDGLSQTKLNNDSRHSVGEFETRKTQTTPFWPYLSDRSELYNYKYYPKTFLKKSFNSEYLKVDRAELSEVKKSQYFNLTKMFLDSLVVNNQTEPFLINKTSYYDFSQLDDLGNFAANVAQQSAKKPLSLVRGVINEHNLFLLQNSIVDKSFETSQHWETNFSKNIKKLYFNLKKKTWLGEKKMSKKEFMRLLNLPQNLKSQTFQWPSTMKKIPELLSDRLAYYADLRNKNLNLLRILKENNVVSTSDVNLQKLIFFNVLFQNNNKIVEKVEDSELFWGYRQRKYKRFKKYIFKGGYQYDPTTLEPLAQNKPKARILKNTLVTALENNKKTDNAHYHNSIKYNRHRGELVPVNLARRLLRTKRTLVLPAHVNITIITNSYDVVHSWFVPGLGLKLDCVPGRSTHHSFYVDNVGFYYGQCAEICGRYHHHMPIRLCALTFEHFLVWWQKKGLRRLHRFNLLTDATKEKKQFLDARTGASMK